MADLTIPYTLPQTTILQGYMWVFCQKLIIIFLTGMAAAAHLTFTLSYPTGPLQILPHLWLLTANNLKLQIFPWSPLQVQVLTLLVGSYANATAVSLSKLLVQVWLVGFQNL